MSKVWARSPSRAASLTTLKGFIVKKVTSHRALKLPGFVLAVASLALSAGAQAQNASTNSGSADTIIAQAGPNSSSSGSGSMMGSTMSTGLYAPGASYIGFNAGRSNFNSLGNGTGIYASNRRDTSYSLSGGSYLNDNLGVELAYSAFGRVSRAGGTTDAEGISLSLIAKAPIAQQFNLLGRLGTTYGRSNVSSAVGSGVSPGRASGFGLSYGIGAEYAFSPSLSAVVQYDEYNLKFANAGRSRINTTSLGLRYRF